MDLKKVEEIVQKIQCSLFKNANSFSVGMLKSQFRGSGLQFREHQVYCYGDDDRFIDWKMLAKTGTPYIKTFEEERNVEICVVLDSSLSMFMGYKGVSKFQVAAEVICLLYLITEESNDSVRVIIKGTKSIVLPAMVGRPGVTRFIAELQKCGMISSDGKVNYRYGEMLQKDSKFIEEKHIVQKIGINKEIVVLSDFHDFMSDKELKRLMHTSRLHCFKIVSPIEKIGKYPFFIQAFNSNSINQSGYWKVNKNNNKDDISKVFGRRMKSLSVDKRYLEEFIKGMI